MSDTQICASAVWHLRNELAQLGLRTSIDWRAAADAQREVEIAYLSIYETVQAQARDSLK